MINWRNPLVDIPKDGQGIFVLDWHWKESIPGSYRIFGGTFEASYGDLAPRVCENDDAGQGGAYYRWPQDEDQVLDCDYICAWVPAEEINLPDWIKPNKNK